MATTTEREFEGPPHQSGNLSDHHIGTVSLSDYYNSAVSLSDRYRPLSSRIRLFSVRC